MLQDAPCDWFAKATPNTWGTDHRVWVSDTFFIEKLSFGPGVFQLSNGADAYTFLETKCRGGH